MSVRDNHTFPANSHIRSGLLMLVMVSFMNDEGLMELPFDAVTDLEM